MIGNEVESDDSINKRILQSQIDLKNKEIEKLDKAIPVLNQLIDIQEQMSKIDEEVGEIMVSKFKKYTPSYEYEDDERFQQLMVEKQKLLLTKNKLDSENDLKKIKQVLEDTNSKKEILLSEIEKINSEMNSE